MASWRPNFVASGRVLKSRPMLNKNLETLVIGEFLASVGSDHQTRMERVHDSRVPDTLSIEPEGALA